MANQNVQPHAADLLMATVQGIAVQVVFDAAGWPPQRQRALRGDALRLLFPDA